MKAKWLAIIGALVLFGCFNLEEQKEISIERINLMNTKDASIQEKISIDKHVILETTDGSLFGHITKMLIKGDYIFFLDKVVTKSIFMFNMDGRFIRKWTVGKGPDQFKSADDFYVASNADTLIVLAGYSKKLLSYDTKTGALIKEKEAPEGARSFTIEKGRVIYEMNPKYGYHLTIENLEGELKNQVKLPFYSSDIVPGMFGFKHHNNNITRLFPLDTIIYEISDGNAKPKFTLHFGDDQAVLNDGHLLIKGKGEVIGLRHWLIEDYIVITYTIDRKSFYEIHNLSTGETIYNVVEGSMTGDNIVLGFLGGISTTVGNQLVVNVNAQTIALIKAIIKYVGEDNLSEKTKANLNKLVEISPKVKDTDNPVLLFLNID